jgi:hypothetical protein
MSDDQWLIRTVENRILGPYTGEQVRRLILDRKLGPQDEVCHGNSYWFRLQEKQEVFDQLGIDPEIAETEEELSDDVTVALVGDPSIPDLPVDARGSDEAVLSNRLLRQVKRNAPIGSATARMEPQVRGDIARSTSFELVRLWKFLAVLLGGVVLILLYAVMNRFRA